MVALNPAIAPAAPREAGIQMPVESRHTTAGRLRTLLGSWRYVEAKRDLRLDLLRGFAAFAMIVDHVGPVESSWLAFLTGANRFCVSAAEAFVFISGFVMGMVYR